MRKLILGGHPLTYAWSIQNAPVDSTSALSDTTAQKPTFTPDKIGDYTFQLIVNNGYADSDPATVAIHATPPVAKAGTDQTVNVNSVVTLDGSLSSDPDGDPITSYKWTITSKPLGSNAILSSPTIQKPMFTADMVGDYSAQLIVNDGYVDSTPATVTIHATQLALTVPVDIEPGLCPNLIGINMKGPILIVAIPGTKDKDAKKIDPATITLSREGISGTVTPRYNKVLDIATPYSGPAICSCQSKFWDGTKDLVLVFDVGEVVTNLQLRGVIGQTVPFVVQGSLKTEYGKTPLSGSDCMKVLSVSNERIWQNI
jgi:hypothetical protein